MPGAPTHADRMLIHRVAPGAGCINDARAHETAYEPEPNKARRYLTETALLIVINKQVVNTIN